MARKHGAAASRFPVNEVGGKQIPLGDLADVVLEETPPGIDHEATRRRTFVSVNVRDRDVASFVYEAKAAIEKQVSFPAGYTITWGGDFENLQSASLRLTADHASRVAADLSCCSTPRSSRCRWRC